MASWTPVPDDRRCTAKSKSTGERCQQPAVTGRTKCRYHGGRSPAGQAAGMWKHGKYSRYVPSRYAESMAKQLGDPKLLEMRHEIALIGARTDEVLEGADVGATRELLRQMAACRSEAGTQWTTAQQAQRDSARMEAAGDAEGAARERERATAAMRAWHTQVDATWGLIDRGVQIDTAWDEAQKLISLKAKVTAEERRRVESEKAYATLQEVENLFARYAVEWREAILRNVADPKEQKAVLSDAFLRAKVLHDEMTRGMLPRGDE